MSTTATAHRVRYANLPADMQQLISDLINRYDLDDYTFTLHRVPSVFFPALDWLQDDYDCAAAECWSYIPGVRDESIPPLVVLGDAFLDGCHRLTAARLADILYLPVIDLAETGATQAALVRDDVIGRMAHMLGDPDHD